MKPLSSTPLLLVYSRTWNVSSNLIYLWTATIILKHSLGPDGFSCCGPVVSGVGGTWVNRRETFTKGKLTQRWLSCLLGTTAACTEQIPVEKCASFVILYRSDSRADNIPFSRRWTKCTSMLIYGHGITLVTPSLLVYSRTWYVSSSLTYWLPRPYWDIP